MSEIFGDKAVPTLSSNFILRHLQDDLNLVGRNGQDHSLPKQTKYTVNGKPNGGYLEQPPYFFI